MKKLSIITTLMFAGVAPFLWGSEKLNHMDESKKNVLLQVARAFQYQRGSSSDKEACSELGALIFTQEKAIPTVFTTLLEGEEVSVIERENDHDGKVLSVSLAVPQEIGIVVCLRNFRIIDEWEVELQMENPEQEGLQMTWPLEDSQKKVFRMKMLDM